MQDFVTVTGMVIKSIPISDYDRRITILTKERGKIGVFAKGARRMNNRFMAPTNPFSFGIFKLYEGKSSYNLADVQIQNYFENLREDFEGAYLGMYFLEVVDYYTRENNDEVEVLKLLYQSLRAISHKSLKRELVQAIFEVKILAVNGEFPGILHSQSLKSDTIYAVEYVVKSTIEKLFTFALSDEILVEFTQLAREYRKKYIGAHFNSLDIVENCRLKN